MSHQDNVFRLLVEANPIPEIEDLDLADVGGPQYLATLEQRSSEVTQIETRQAQAKRASRRGWILGLAAALAVVLSAAALFIALNEGDPVVATTSIPTERASIELQGQGNRNSPSFELAGGSYSVETITSGDCSYVFYLSRSGTGHRVMEITSMSQQGTQTVSLDDVPAGSYFVTVSAESEFSCPWSMEFTGS